MSTANVNRPTDFAQKEKDVNQKLQFYGIFTAFSEGKVPSNEQIDVALNSFLRSRALGTPSKNLSREGQELVQDVKQVINEAKKLLLSKNQGNLIQEFVWDAQGISGGNARTPNAPVDKATARQHGDEALDGLKTLGRLILSNGQFRKLLDDALVLARDVAGDAAQEAANKVNPSEDRLKSIDEPAEDNTWHDVPHASDLKQKASDTYQSNKPFSREDAKQAAREGADTAQQHPTNDQQAGRAGANNAAQNLRQKAEANVPEETKENVRNASSAVQQKSKNYLSKKMPQERREQTVYRLKKMIVEIQGHSDYQEAIETLLNLAERYSSHGRDLAQQSTGTVKGARQDSELQRCETNLKTLIERFANFTSTDDITDALNNIYRDADRDPELRNWFTDVNKYIRKCLREQGYVLKESSDREWDRLYDKAQFLFRERYRDHADHLVDEIKFLVDQFDQDPQNRAFAQTTEKLFLDLGRDENGTPAFKPHLIKDLTEVIIPGIFANTRYVPVPRIEVSDPMIDLIVENLVIESDNLFPNSLEFRTDNYWRFGRKTVRGTRENKVMIAGSGIQMDLRDVSYYLKKKQGFPSITDKGVMDIILAGEGFSFKINARNAHKSSDRTHFIAIDNVDVVVHNLQIKIKKSNHKLLFSMAKSIVLKVMKPAIQKAIEKQIKDNFEKADAYAYDIYREVQKGKEAAKRDPENAANIYQQWVNAFQTKAMQKKKKAEKASKDMEVNVAMTQQDSMFKHIQLPGGISTKATEYKELAQKGERWQSPIFGIGSAGKSSDIPRAHEVKRRPHSTRSGGVRGGNHPSASSTSNTGAAGLSSSGNRSGDYGATSGSSRGYDIGSSGTSGYDSRTGPTSGYDSRTGPTSGLGNVGGVAGVAGAAGLAGAGSGYGTTSSQAGGYGTSGMSTGGYGATSGQTTSGYGTSGGLSGLAGAAGTTGPTVGHNTTTTGTTGYDIRGGGASGYSTGGPAGAYDDIRSGNSAGYGTQSGTAGFYGDDSNSRNTNLPIVGGSHNTSTGQNVPSGFNREVDQALNPSQSTTYYDSATTHPRQ